MIIAEYLLGATKKEADFQSRNVKDSNEYKLNPVVFQRTFHQCETPDLDLFASLVSRQVPVYTSWKLNLYSKNRNAFQISWTHIQSYAFPPLSLSLSLSSLLTGCFHEGFEYNKTRGFRSAISAYHDPVEEVSVGQNDRVSALL